MITRLKSLLRLTPRILFVILVIILLSYIGSWGEGGIKEVINDNVKTTHHLNGATRNNLKARKDMSAEMKNFLNLGIAKVNPQTRQRRKFIMSPPRFNTQPKSFENNIHVVNVIKSTFGYRDRRNAIRTTWGSIDFTHDIFFHTVFVLGCPKNVTDLKSIAREYALHKDIVLIDLEENYSNVGLKTLAGMQWVSENIPHNWLYSSGDDDVVLNPYNLAKFIGTTSKSYQNLPISCIYNFQEHDSPARDISSKWYISEEQYSQTEWPPYCRGGWYTMPVRTVSKLFEISMHQNYLPLDDVWITGILRTILYIQDSDMRTAEKGRNISDIKDMGIIPAPHSVRTELELTKNTGVKSNELIVRHIWGNPDNLNKLNVTKELHKIWRVWYAMRS